VNRRKLHSLAVLIQRGDTHNDHSSCGIRLGRPHVECISFHMQLVARSDSLGPPSLEADADDATDRSGIPLGEQSHGQGSGVPAARGKTLEYRGAWRLRRSNGTAVDRIQRRTA
jgi:hypothetical protein